MPALSDAELAALIKACDGKAFRDQRDEAIVRLAFGTASRAEEILGMEVADVDLKRGLAVICRGKGGRAAGFRSARGPLRHSTGTSGSARPTGSPGRPRCGSATGARISPTTGSGTPCSAGRMAGIDGFPIHRLRHTAASRWRFRGARQRGRPDGGRGVAVAGWRSRHMLDRYVADTAMRRAADEARSLNLGDL
ncbi:MAG: tyrosine-type recombinase/integrase [Streptosporangiaceae bacterium]